MFSSACHARKEAKPELHTCRWVDLQHRAVCALGHRRHHHRRPREQGTAHRAVQQRQLQLWVKVGGALLEPRGQAPGACAQKLRASPWTLISLCFWAYCVSGPCREILRLIYFCLSSACHCWPLSSFVHAFYLSLIKQFKAPMMAFVVAPQVMRACMLLVTRALFA